jgi:predicted site-specific integrase-resolvase
VYARVSSADQKPDLDRQVARVTAWATAQEMPVDKDITEVGSALVSVDASVLTMVSPIIHARCRTR